MPGCVSLCSSVSPRRHTLQKKITSVSRHGEGNGKSLWRLGQVSIFWPAISNHVWWPRNGTPARMNQGEHHFLKTSASIHRDDFRQFFRHRAYPPERPSLQHRTATTTASKRRTSAPLKTRPPCASVPPPSGRRSTLSPHLGHHIAGQVDQISGWPYQNNPVPRPWICARGDWRLRIQIFARCALAESTKYCNVPAVTRTGIQSQCLSARRKRNLSRSLDVLFTVTGIAESTNVARFLKNPVWSSFT